MTALSFKTDIRPLFRTRDRTAMQAVAGFDLFDYDDVSQRAQEIAARLKDGTMPCDAAWPPEQIEIFERWVAEGMAR